jgi:hypothetical protein
MDIPSSIDSHGNPGIPNPPAAPELNVKSVEAVVASEVTVVEVTLVVVEDITVIKVVTDVEICCGTDRAATLIAWMRKLASENMIKM